MLEQKESILVTTDMLYTNSKVFNSSTEKLPVLCQYCGSADHQSSVCPQAQVWAMCKTKNHTLMYIGPSLKEIEDPEKDNRAYKSDNPSLRFSKKVY